MSEKASQGCAGFFSRMTPKTESEVGSKLRPGIALPHITCATTEVGCLGGVEIGALLNKFRLRDKRSGSVGLRCTAKPMDLNIV